MVFNYGIRRYFFFLAFVAAFFIFTRHASAQSTDPDDVKNQNFSFITRLHYDSALTNGVKTLNVMVAAKMGRTEQAVAAFTGLGGKVAERFDAVGYFWGNIPTDQLPKLLAVQDIVEFQLDGPSGATIQHHALNLPTV